MKGSVQFLNGYVEQGVEITVVDKSNFCDTDTYRGYYEFPSTFAAQYNRVPVKAAPTAGHEPTMWLETGDPWEAVINLDELPVVSLGEFYEGLGEGEPALDPEFFAPAADGDGWDDSIAVPNDNTPADDVLSDDELADLEHAEMVLAEGEDFDPTGIMAFADQGAAEGAALREEAPYSEE